MYIYVSNLFKVTLLTFVLIISFSCSKDSEILVDYIGETPEKILLNDINISTIADQPIVITPIDEETYINPKKVSITKVTPPKIGTIVLQEDNTIIYTPDPEKTGTDEFDYTTSVINPDE